MTPPTFQFLKAKSELAAYAAQVGSRLLRLKAGFNPNQPRLPAGNPDGGQWTDAGAAGNALSSPKVAEQRIVRDRAGEQPWSSYIEQYRPDGSVVSRAITNRNGSKIAAAYSLPGIERNTVTLRNGVRLTFENNGDTQRVLDASGNLLSETALTLDGTAARPVLRPVLFDSRNPVRTPTPLSYPAKVVLNAATELYNWWQSSKEPDEEVVFSFRADKLVPVPGEPPLWTSKLKREEVEDACPRFPLVQRMTNQVAKSLNPTLFKNKGAYGTAIHMGVKVGIDALRDPNFTTEVSIFKSDLDASRYALKGTVRIDILENRDDNFVCVYDLKTGSYPMPTKRFLEIYLNVMAKYPKANGVIITEVRPAP